MPTEMEVWNLFWLAVMANGVWFAGAAFLLWVSFRAANMAGEGDNLIGKIVVSVFCLFAVMQLNFNQGVGEWIGNGMAGVFVNMQAQGVELSQGALRWIEGSANPGGEFNLMPDLMGGLFLLTILIMQMYSIWMKK